MLRTTYVHIAGGVGVEKMADPIDVGLSVAGNHGAWWSFEPPERVEGEVHLWACIDIRDPLETNFVEQANAHAWSEIGDEIRAEELEAGHRPGTFVFFSMGCLWVKIFTDDKKNELTPGGEKVVDAMCALADYPCLDDTKCSELEYNAQRESITRGLDWSAVADDLCPHDDHEEIISAVWDWIWRNEQDAMEHRDGEVSESAIDNAIKALGWKEPEDKDEFVALVSNPRKER